MNQSIKSRLLVAGMLCSLALTGCASSSGKKRPTQKEQAVKQWNGTRAAVMASMARSQYDAGNFTQCEQTVRDAMKLNSENADLHLLSAKLAIQQGHLEVAESELALVTKYAPNNAEADYLTGVVCERAGKHQDALDAYTRAAEKVPTEVAYVLARAEILVDLDRPLEALQFVQEKSLAFDQSAPLHDTLGELLVGQSRYEEAVAALRQASVMAPDDQQIREHLAMAYYFNKQYAEGGEIFKALLDIEKNQSRSELWLALGECQMQCVNAREVRNSFDRACQAAPSAPRHGTAWPRRRCSSAICAALRSRCTSRSRSIPPARRPDCSWAI